MDLVIWDFENFNRPGVFNCRPFSNLHGSCVGIRHVMKPDRDTLEEFVVKFHASAALRLNGFIKVGGILNE